MTNHYGVRACKAHIIPHAEDDGGDPQDIYETNSFLHSQVLAKALSEVREYDWVEIWEDGQKTRVYVRGRIVMSAG